MTKIGVVREWFSVPIEAIDEAIQLLAAGTIVNYADDATSGQVRLALFEQEES